MISLPWLKLHSNSQLGSPHWPNRRATAAPASFHVLPEFFSVCGGFELPADRVPSVPLGSGWWMQVGQLPDVRLLQHWVSFFLKSNLFFTFLGVPMNSLILWAALALVSFVPTNAIKLNAGCPECDCCGCCDTGVCECKVCACDCCATGCDFASRAGDCCKKK